MGVGVPALNRDGGCHGLRNLWVAFYAGPGVELQQIILSDAHHKPPCLENGRSDPVALIDDIADQVQQVYV